MFVVQRQMPGEKIGVEMLWGAIVLSIERNANNFLSGHPDWQIEAQ